MPRISGSNEHVSTSDCTGCRKQSGTLQCIECIRDGSGSAVFCANGCFKAHWQQHRKALLRQASSPSPAIKTDNKLDQHVVNMKTGGAGQRAFSGQVLLHASKERMVFRADTAAFQPRAVYATGSANRR
ncbi:Methionine aminopeptidase 1 [Trebouxia sp. C0009 RCD-2024]